MVKIKHGDITSSADDVIVNAANKTLLGGGGVDSAIQHAAGDGLLLHCMSLPSVYGARIKPFSIVKTPSFKLQSKEIWHVVGPVFNGSNFDELEKTYQSIMQEAVNSGIESVSIPAISTGAYGFPSESSLILAKAVCEGYGVNVTLYVY